MAEHDHTTSPNATGSSRRALAGGALLALLGATAASAAPAKVASADAGLLALRARLEAAAREADAVEVTDPHPGLSEEEHEAWVERTGDELEDACWAIVEAPAAATAKGRALKAAAAMYQLRMAAPHGHWPGSGEELAWLVMSEIAGDVYVPPVLPEHLAHCEPDRA